MIDNCRTLHTASQNAYVENIYRDNSRYRNDDKSSCTKVSSKACFPSYKQFHFVLEIYLLISMNRLTSLPISRVYLRVSYSEINNSRLLYNSVRLSHSDKIKTASETEIKIRQTDLFTSIYF